MPDQTTPTRDEIAAQVAAQERRIKSSTWQDIPRGYYAMPVEDIPDCDCEDWGCGCTVLLGYRLFQRKESRVTRTGRRIGKNQFISGKTVAAPDTDHELTENPDLYRAEYGKFTGKCGCCGRALTDPDSKLRGIGPECRKGAQP